MQLDNEGLTPETKARIDAHQITLNEMKVKDLHFCWGPEAHKKTKEERAIEVCKALDAIFAGEFTPAPPIGDSNHMETA
jgi:hypothetical protein